MSVWKLWTGGATGSRDCLPWTSSSLKRSSRHASSYVVRRKQVVNPAGKTFNGSVVIAEATDPTRTYNDPILNDANRYDYKVLRKISNAALLFYPTDHLGTPVGSALSNLRFPGQYFDLETGLHQNWFRFYRPTVGR